MRVVHDVYPARFYDMRNKIHTHTNGFNNVRLYTNRHKKKIPNAFYQFLVYICAIVVLYVMTVFFFSPVER